MAEAIQRKMKAELEKYTQMQKGGYYILISCHVVLS